MTETNDNGTTELVKRITYHDVMGYYDEPLRVDPDAVMALVHQAGSDLVFKFRDAMSKESAVAVVSGGCEGAWEIVRDLSCGGDEVKAAELLAQYFRDFAARWKEIRSSSKAAA